MPTYAKALAAFVLNALGGLAVVLTGPASSFADVTDGQWVALAASSVGAGLAVYGIRNGLSPDPTTSTPQRDPGAVSVVTVVAVLVGICAVIYILGHVNFH